MPTNDTPSPRELSFHVAWQASLSRTDGGRPEMPADYVARQGRAIRVIDVRAKDALLGALGYVPGADWVPEEDARSLLERLDPTEAVVFVCEDGRRSLELAAAFESLGLRRVAAMRGGMRAWKRHGLLPSRDPEVLQRRGVLGPKASWASAESASHFRLDEIQDHVGHPRSVRWLKLAAFLLNGRLSCVDGRDHVAVVGTPGGDAGELVLVLAAAEALLGAPLPEGSVTQVLRRRLDAFGGFAFHTDTDAGDRLIASIRADARTKASVEGISDPLEFRHYFAGPPADVQPALLDVMVRPEHLGCGHLRLMVQHPERYGVRASVVERVVKAALQFRWDGGNDLEVTPLPGSHSEGAVVNVHVSEPLEAFARVPLVAPAIGGRQMFVNHPDVVAFLRRQLVRWLCQQRDLFPALASKAEALDQAVAALHAKQLMATLTTLAAGLPIFDVTVHPDGKATVAATGHVPTHA